MIKINGLLVKQFNFPGGEVSVRLPKGLKAGVMYITAWLQSSDSIIALSLTCDALRRHFGKDVKLNLTVPYYPYARQDRVCSNGESLSKEVIFKLITSQCQSNFKSFDVHSNTDKVIEVTLLDIFKQIEFKFTDDTILVAPDLGSTEKVKALAEYYSLDWIQGIKQRDPETGKLSGFGFETDLQYDFTTKDLLIVDDICDGGGTFIGLAEVLEEHLTPKTLSLYVTHGIFSKGVTDLLRYFDTIYTTDTYLTDIEHKALVEFKVVES